MSPSQTPLICMAQEEMNVFLQTHFIAISTFLPLNQALSEYAAVSVMTVINFQKTKAMPESILTFHSGSLRLDILPAGKRLYAVYA